MNRNQNYKNQGNNMWKKFSSNYSMKSNMNFVNKNNLRERIEMPQASKLDSRIENPNNVCEEQRQALRYSRTDLLLRRYDLLCVEHIWMHEYENDPYYLSVVNRLQHFNLWKETPPAAYEPLYNIATLEDCSDADISSIVLPVNEAHTTTQSLQTIQTAQAVQTVQLRNNYGQNRRRGRSVRNYSQANNQFQTNYTNPTTNNYSNMFCNPSQSPTITAVPQTTPSVTPQDYSVPLYVPQQYYSYQPEEQNLSDMMTYYWYPNNKYN